MSHFSPKKNRAVVAKPQLCRMALIKEMQAWLSMESVHFFIRPLLGNLVMVDLDNFQGDMEVLLALRPRALVRTSVGNYQIWLTIPDQLASKTAIWVTNQLTAALGGDAASSKVTQQGRLPGSRNVKVGKGDIAVLVSSSVQHMDEQISCASPARPR